MPPPTEGNFSQKHVVETASTEGDAVPLYVADGAEAKAMRDVARSSLEEVGYEGPSGTALEPTTSVYTRFRRADGMGPDGDALQAFERSSHPMALVVRKRPPVYRERTKVVKVIFNPKSRTEIGSLMRLRRRGCGEKYWGCIYHKRYTTLGLPDGESPAMDASKLFPSYDTMVAVPIPKDGEALEAIADGVGVFNEDEGSGVELEPYLKSSMDIIAAACTIQACYRSHLCRAKLEPSLSERVLWRRAITCIQRYRRSQRWRQRMSMLVKMARMVHLMGEHDTFALAHRELAHLRTIVEDAQPVRPFPEHELVFSFDAQHRLVLVREDQDEEAEEARWRYGPPAWSRVEVPIVQGDAEKEAAGVHGDSIDFRNAELLLTTATEELDLPPEPDLTDRLRSRGLLLPYEEKPARLFRFESPEEAKRRASVLFLLTWSARAGMRGVELVPNPLRPLTPLSRGSPSPTPEMQEYVEDLGLAGLLPPTSQLRRYVGDGRREPDEEEVLGPWKPGRKPTPEPAVVFEPCEDAAIPRFHRALARENLARKYGLHAGVVRDIALVQSYEEAVEAEFAAVQDRGVHGGEPPKVAVLPPDLGNSDEHQHASEARELADKTRDYKEAERLAVQDLLARGEAELEAHKLRQVAKAKATRTFHPRSADTSSHYHADTPQPWEVREQARKLREEVKREHAEFVEDERRKQMAARDAVEDLMIMARDEVAKRSQAEAEALRGALRRKQDGHLSASRLAVARRKWRVEMKRRREHDTQFAFAFERQHNALSRQIMAAELRHRRELEAEYTAHHVDLRREDGERRTEAVDAEIRARRDRAQELADEQVLAVQEALEARREEEEEALANAREAVRLQRNQHFTLWPGAGARRLRTERKPLLLPQVVSAAEAEEQAGFGGSAEPDWSQWTGEEPTRSSSHGAVL